MTSRATGWYPMYLPDHRFSPPIYRAYKYVWMLEEKPRQFSNNLEDFSKTLELYGGHVYSTTSWQWNLYKFRVRNETFIEQRFSNALKRLNKKARQ